MSLWTPKAPGDYASLTEAVADLENGGPVFAELSIALGNSLAGRGRFPGGYGDIEMAVHYSWNALRHLWIRLTPEQHRDSSGLVLAVATTLRDAERLYHSERDDDYAYGKCTFREFVNVASSLWKRETGEEVDLFEDPRTNPLAPYPDTGEDSLHDLYDVTMWLPEVFRERFELLNEVSRRLIAERLKVHLAYVEAIVPATVEHGLVVSWAVAATDGFPTACQWWRSAMNAGKPILTYSGAAPDSTYRCLAKWLEALRQLAAEREDGAPFHPELESLLALVDSAWHGELRPPEMDADDEESPQPDALERLVPGDPWSRLISFLKKWFASARA